jgi:hypothetical protein
MICEKNMTHPSKENLPQELLQLASCVKRVVVDGVSTGLLRSENHQYSRILIEKSDITYTDRGFLFKRIATDDFTRPSWARATNAALAQVTALKEYETAFEYLTRNFGDERRVSRALRNFTTVMIGEFLKETDGIDPNSKIANLVRNLRGEALGFRISARLQGVVMNVERISIADGMILRKPTNKDLIEEMPVKGTDLFEFFPWWSALLEVESTARDDHEALMQVEHAVAVLKLYRVGSVKATRIRYVSDLLTGYGSFEMPSHDVTEAAVKYQLTADDEMKLAKFHDLLGNEIPRNFYDKSLKDVDYLAIGYQRYADALTQDAILERRFGNAVMGLEALFLRGGERQELAFRLAVRIGRLLGLLGYDALEVRQRVIHAYNVRSAFAHGSQLSDVEEKSLSSKYGSIEGLLLSNLDYLRLSLVAAILLHRTKNKEDLIHLLDDALISEASRQELIATALPVLQEITKLAGS